MIKLFIYSLLLCLASPSSLAATAVEMAVIDAGIQRTDSLETKINKALRLLNEQRYFFPDQPPKQLPAPYESRYQLDSMRTPEQILSQKIGGSCGSSALAFAAILSAAGVSQNDLRIVAAVVNKDLAAICPVAGESRVAHPQSGAPGHVFVAVKFPNRKWKIINSIGGSHTYERADWLSPDEIEKRIKSEAVAIPPTAFEKLPKEIYGSGLSVFQSWILDEVPIHSFEQRYDLIAAGNLKTSPAKCRFTAAKSVQRIPNQLENKNSIVDPSKWHGFNLLNMFWKNWKDEPFQEKDFQLIQELGFNFVRLPLDYRILTDENNWLKLNETRMLQIDDAMAWGKKYKIHICLNLHRAPGYVVSDKEPEKTNLWSDKKAQEAFLNLWKTFATRYKGIPASDLSFNLVNEPANIDAENLLKVLQPVIQAIKQIDPQRTIILDGLEWGKKPINHLQDITIIQATRGYSPHKLLSWNPDPAEPSPKWPSKEFNKQWLVDNEIVPWKSNLNEGVLVFVGEFGARNVLPHKFVLSWMEDQLKVWKDAHWGWALWNLYGEHGILDSDRKDVNYENFKGHKLDRKMLNLLQNYK